MTSTPDQNPSGSVSRVGCSLLTFGRLNRGKRGTISPALVPYILKSHQQLGLSTRTIAKFLSEHGHRASHSAVHRLLKNAAKKELSEYTESLNILERLLPDLEETSAKHNVAIADILRNEYPPSTQIQSSKEWTTLAETQKRQLEVTWQICQGLSCT